MSRCRWKTAPCSSPAGAEEDVAESAMILYRKLAACCGFQDKGILCATDVWAAGEIQEKNVLQDAYNLGKIL